ncbi:CWC16 protein [Kockiozyma suomiensis]|uniref:CWC16 protein n=1 Tax=Kockiozyma suomiensis TaxID=1337062 RepID=UPI0033440F4F
MQGYNKYYPPDYDGKSSLNKLAGKHSLGNRARKLNQGILVVRFELPFDIFCLACEKYISQGTRFNAEKKRIGAYFTTPIFSFRFKCHLCKPTTVHGEHHYIEIQTDPAKTEYKVTEGARRSKNDDSGYAERLDNAIQDDENATDVFAKVEKEIAEATQRRRASKRIEELYKDSNRRWGDPYTRNQELRRIFKGERKETEKRNRVADSLEWRLAKVSQHRKRMTKGEDASEKKKSAKQILLEAVTRK